MDVLREFSSPGGLILARSSSLFIHQKRTRNTWWSWFSDLSLSQCHTNFGLLFSFSEGLSALSMNIRVTTARGFRLNSRNEWFTISFNWFATRNLFNHRVVCIHEYQCSLIARARKNVFTRNFVFEITIIYHFGNSRSKFINTRDLLNLLFISMNTFPNEVTDRHK